MEHTPRHRHATRRTDDELVAHLAEAIHSDLDLHGVLERVTDAATRLSGATLGAFVHAPGPETTGAAPVLVGASPDAAGRLVDARLDRLLADVTASGTTLRTGDLPHDRRHPLLAAALAPLRSCLVAPVAGRDGTVAGALLLAHAEPDAFDESTEILVSTIAAHAAIAVDNARLLEAEKRARRNAEQVANRLALLQEVTSWLADARTTSDAMDALRDSLLRRTRARRVGLYQPVGDSFEAVLGEQPVTGPTVLPRSLDTPIADAFRSQEVVLVADRAELAATYPAAPTLVPDAETVLAVPLVVRGAALGVLAFSWHEPHPLDAPEVAMFVAVAGQLAAAMERARLDEAQARSREQLRAHVAAVTDSSLTLQRSLLPQELPEVDTVDIAVRYRPGAAGAAVGGDWYDVIVSPQGTITFVVGDVQGHSISAAAVMGQLRMAMHAYIAEGHDPDVAVAQVNQLMVSLRVDVLATCVLATLNPCTGELLVVRAGHPLPVLTDADGTTSELDADGGLPLGTDEDLTWPVSRFTMQPGSRLVLYTDGLVERRDAPMDETVAELVASVHDLRGQDTEKTADTVLADARAHADDDVALLVCDYRGHGGLERVGLTVDRREEVAHARAFAAEALERWGLDSAEDAVLLLVSEMVTNALVHARSAARLALWQLPDAVRIEVSDDSPSEPRPRVAAADALGGRGMLLVEALSSRWGTMERRDGKTVWAQVPA